MSVSYISSVSDVPGVQTAISHLQDLQTNMRSAEGFQTADVRHIDVIIQCIQDLEQERLKAHELLETETIKASVLRHKLLYFPDEIRNEITEAVGAARRDNEEELASLNKELNEINAEISSSSIKLKELENENTILGPERDRVKADNEEVIALLNERMADKALEQIMLNDTRDKLRATNQRIVDLEEGLVILKEDLIQERNDHRMERTRLKEIMADTAEKTREQKHTNSVKKLELTNFRDEFSNLSSEYTALKDRTLKIEEDISELNDQEQELEKMQTEQLAANETLRKKGQELDQHGAQMDKDFDQRKAQAMAKIAKLNRDIDREKSRGELLEVQRKEAEEKYMQANEIRKKFDARVNELMDQMQRAQDMYKDKVEEVGRFTQENQEMEVRLVELAEEHEMLVRNLNAEIAAEREKLALKRNERLELQAEREVSQKILTDHRAEQQKYLREMNKRVSELRNSHDSLTEEGRELRKIIKQDEKDIKSTEKELENAIVEFTTMKVALEVQIEKLEKSIEKLNEEKDEKQKALAEKIPIFEALEKEHDEATEKFDLMKKSIVTLKNKKVGLEDTVQRTLRDIDKLAVPRKAAEDELQKQRALTLWQFNAHAVARQVIEREIYSVGAKLKTVLEENDRFRKAIEDLQRRKEKLLRELEMIALKKDRLGWDLKGEKDDLRNAWLVDQDMTEETASRDRAIIEQFSDLLGQTEERQKIITSISQDLSEELGRLDKFMKAVSSKRPKEVRKDIKKMSQQLSREGASRLTSKEGECTRSVSQASQSILDTQTPMTLQTPRNASRVTSRNQSRAPSIVVTRHDTIQDKF